MNLIFVFPCIIIYGFIRTSLMQIVQCYFITLCALHVSDVIHSLGWMCITSETCRAQSVIK